MNILSISISISFYNNLGVFFFHFPPYRKQLNYVRFFARNFFFFISAFADGVGGSEACARAVESFSYFPTICSTLCTHRTPTQNTYLRESASPTSCPSSGQPHDLNLHKLKHPHLYTNTQTYTHK